MTTEIQRFVAKRGIQEVLHFTTSRGLLGVLDRRQLLSRKRVSEEQRLDSVKLLNCEYRKDPAWVDYINMSISVVNKDMLGYSKGWHDSDGIWWAVLSFAPDILDDDDVWFTTTNNSYESTVRRQHGIGGLRDMYSEPIPWGHYGSTKSRGSTIARNQPTDRQAEVLYPKKLKLSRLIGIYVAEAEHVDQIESWKSTLPKIDHINVRHRPEVFQ